MKEDNQNKSSSEEIYCLLLKHKIHCSQLEGTEASMLPEERRYEFCLNKCPVYKIQKQKLRKMKPKRIFLFISLIIFLGVGQYFVLQHYTTFQKARQQRFIYEARKAAWQAPSLALKDLSAL